MCRVESVVFVERETNDHYDDESFIDAWAES